MPTSNLHKKIMSLLLLSDRLAVEELCDEIKVEESVMSQQLALLTKENLVQAEETKKEVLYSINETHLAKIIEMVSHLTPDKP